MHGVDVRIADTAVALVGGETLHPQRCELGGYGGAAERHARGDRIRTDPRAVHLRQQYYPLSVDRLRF